MTEMTVAIDSIPPLHCEIQGYVYFIGVETGFIESIPFTDVGGEATLTYDTYRVYMRTTVGELQYYGVVTVAEASGSLSDILNDAARSVAILETSTTTATVSDNTTVHICNSVVDYTLTLPTVSIGKSLLIINKNTATVTLSGTISDVSATSILYAGESINLIYDGTEWC